MTSVRDDEGAGSVTPRLIDTHAHIISMDRRKYPPAPLNGVVKDEMFLDTFDLDQLLRGMDETGVSHACAVQRAFAYGYDNSYVLDAARLHPDRLTPVVVLPADAPESAQTLRDLAESNRLGGLRLSSPSFAALDTAWFNAPAAIETWRAAADLGLPVAIIFPAAQLSFVLPAVRMIAGMFPSLPILLDHLAVPHRANLAVQTDRSRGIPDPYLGPPDYAISSELKAMRPHRNVFFKLTTINVDRLRTDGVDVAAFTRRFVDEFGADRLVWGSDSAQTEGPYARLTDGCREAISLLSDTERYDLCRGTAARLYGFPT